MRVSRLTTETLRSTWHEASALHFLKRWEETGADLDSLRSAWQDYCLSPWHIEDHKRLIDILARDADKFSVLRAAADSYTRGGAKLLDLSYLEKDFSEFAALSEPSHDGGEVNPLGIIALTSLFGEPERFRDFFEDLRLDTYLPDLNSSEANIRCRVLQAGADETGLPHAILEFSFQYPPVTELQFTLSLEKNRAQLTIDTVHLDTSLQGKGLIRKLFQRLLEQATHTREDRPQGLIQQIDLTANVDVGGYAWAVYGFNWNKDLMMPHTNDPSVNPQEHWRQTIQAWLIPKLEEAERYIQLMPPGEKTDSVLKELEEIKSDLQDPTTCELVTPQRIALLGEGGHLFVEDGRVGPNGRPSYELVSGPVQEDQDRSPCHLGKILLLGRPGWHGVMLLNQERPSSRSDHFTTVMNTNSS